MKDLLAATLLPASLLVAGCSTPSTEAQDRPTSGDETGQSAGAAGGATASARYVHPVIADHGRAVALPEAAGQPDPELTYRVVFDVTSGPERPTQVNPGLDKVARFLNVYATAGIEPSDMELIAVLHGKATAAVMNDSAYRRRHGVANPNTALLVALREAEVELQVCGQALAHNEIPKDAVAEHVEVVLAALTAVPTYELRGYAVQPF